MNPAPTSLNDAWAIEMADRGLAHGTPGEEDARCLYYTGAAALMAMFVFNLVNDPRDTPTAIESFFNRMKLEISEYLDHQDWPDD